MEDPTFLGVFSIPVKLLCKPTDAFRVRELDQKRVLQLSKALLANSGADDKDHNIFLSTFVVNVNWQGVLKCPFSQEDVDSHTYMVIDGNHRLAAIEATPERSVHCYVYKDLSPEKAIGLGYQRNTQDANVLKMTELQVTTLIRKVMAGRKNRAANDAVYSCLNLVDVSTHAIILNIPVH